MRFLTILTGALLALPSVNAAPFAAGREKEGSSFVPFIHKRNSTLLPDWRKTCKGPKTQQVWKELHMDLWLHSMSDEIWGGTSTPDANSPKDLTFPQGIMNKIPNYGTKHCDYDNCVLNYPDGSMCTDSDGPSNADFNAFYLFVLWAISNFQQWVKSLQGSLQATVETITTGDTQLLVEDFSHSDTGSTTNPTSEALIIMSSIFGGFAAVLGGVGEAGVGAIIGVAGASVSVANGVVSQMAKSSPNIAEMQDSREAILNHRINSARDALIVQIKNYGNTILDKPVDESQVGYSYSDHANSGPAALKGGAFANQYSADNHTDFAKNVKGTLVSGSISWIWEKEQVYIVKDSYSINGKAPADLDLDSDVSNRTCSNNGTCYWFIKNTGISDPAEDVFDPVSGFDSLQKWGLQPLDVAMAAEASQNAGGYLKNWTVPETLPFLRGSHGSKPPKALMINLPVCSLDFMHSSWPDQSDAGMDGLDWDDSAYLRGIISEACFKQTVNGKNFPYAKKSGPTDWGALQYSPGNTPVPSE